jgi:hypothetical protein
MTVTGASALSSVRSDKGVVVADADRKQKPNATMNGRTTTSAL